MNPNMMISIKTIKMTSCTEILTRKPTNIAVATNPAHEINVLESEIPEPGPDDCLVHVRATGICGSDVHFWKHGNIGPSVITKDCGLGHESAGIVIKVGSNVTTFNIGMSLLLTLRSHKSSLSCIISFLIILRRQSGARMRHTVFETKL